TASQTGGQQSQLYEARSVHFLDTVAPQISLSPTTDGINSFIHIEGGTSYGDDGSVHIWNNNTNTKESSSQTLSVSVVDASEGIIPNSLVKTVYSGIVNNLNVSSSTPIGESIYKTNPVDGSILSDSSIISAVTSQISSSSYSDWNNTFTIKYDASDSLGNQAIPVYRYLIVKDTEPPAINNFYTTPLSDGDNSVVVLNFSYSGSDYDVSSEQNIKDFLISQLTATDANNFTPSNDLIWIVEIEKNVGDGGSYDPLNPYPAIKSNNGYFVTINVKDTSGNTTNTTSTIQLKVGDTTPPVLTMMGQATIHDFLRFKSNSSLPTSNEEISGDDYNTTGFAGGEHRLLYHDYNFVDPGVYAEDANSFFNSSTHPDLDGDGVGEGYAMVKVSSLSDASSCTSGAGLIHVYSHFEENELSLNSSNFSEWQSTLDGVTLGDDNGTIPDVWDSVSNNASDHNFTDSSKSKIVSIKVKTISLNYYVKDGWDNISSPLTRTVHFYQSAQYDGYAFYATPISNKDGGNFEDFYDNGSGNPFLTSVRKDTDGDGVSDYWEVALGTDPQNKSSLPDMTDQSVFQALSGVDPNILKANFNKLNDASALSGVNGINGFSSTP
ncbi:MAG: thrombospondin type 3 repeat-containing protein, partial [Gammaproteobacteria bacterium]